MNDRPTRSLGATRSQAPAMTPAPAMTQAPAMSLVFPLALAMLLVCAPALFAQGWEWQNPKPAGNDINDVLLLADGRGFAVCDGGVVMRSWDAGRTWESRRRFNDDLQHVEHTSDGSLLLTTAQGSLYRSSDNGWNWSDALGLSYAAGNTDIAVLPGGDALVLLGGRNLFLSSLQESVWNNVAAPAVVQSEFFRSISVRSRTEWWLLSTRKLYKTTDAGATWSEDDWVQYRGLIDLVFTDASTVWQLRDGQVLRSDDAGRTWSEMNLFGFGYNIAIETGAAMQGSTFILTQGDYVINRSTDGGATWDVSLTSIAFGDGYAMDMSFSSRMLGVVVGAGGRILRTDDGGLTWSIVHGIGYIGRVSDITFFNARDAYAIGNYATALVTTNGGIRWSELAPLPDWYLNSCSFHTPTNGFLAAQTQQGIASIFATSDRGRSWVQRSVLPIAYDPFFPIAVQSVLAVSDNDVFVGASMGNLYRSSDGGRTWDSLFVSQTLVNEYYTGTSMQRVSPETLIYFSFASVSISTDNGTSWVNRRTPQGRTLVDPHFFDTRSGVGIIGGSFGRTTDGGTTWSLSKESGLSQLSVISSSEFAAFRGDASEPTPSGFRSSSIIRSSDGGTTWSEHPFGERVSPEGIHFHTLDEGWLWGWSGMIRHTSNGGVVHVADDVQEDPAHPSYVSIIDLYPQPFHAARHQALTVGVDVSLDPARPVTIDIVDALGRVHATRTSTASGKRYVVFDQRDLPSSGLYLVRARHGSEQSARPLLVLR